MYIYTVHSAACRVFDERRGRRWVPTQAVCPALPRLLGAFLARAFPDGSVLHPLMPNAQARAHTPPHTHTPWPAPSPTAQSSTPSCPTRRRARARAHTHTHTHTCCARARGCQRKRAVCAPPPRGGQCSEPAPFPSRWIDSVLGIRVAPDLTGLLSCRLAHYAAGLLITLLACSLRCWLVIITLLACNHYAAGVIA